MIRRMNETARKEGKVAQLLMLRATLAECLKNVLKDGFRADQLLCNHISNAQLRAQELLDMVQK